MSSGIATTPANGQPARAWLPWAALLLALLALFHETGASMVAIWIRSETYTHAFLVPVISAWLAWRRRHQLVGLPVRPVPWLLAPIALVCLAWLAGQLAAVQAATHFALVALVVLSVPAVLGWAVARALTFPLLFLFFAVPFGEFMVPQLMEWTADFTVLALQWTGIPVYRDGLQFVIPSGNWSVVEACSGIRYLIASFMVGSLFAYLNYRSPWRRAAFIGVSLVVPLLANWLRAYIIVMLGHLSGNTLAAGADHLVYGWVFFGIVVALMFMIGARWAEPEDDGPAPPAQGARADAWSSRPAGPWWMAVAMALLCGGALAYGWKLDHSPSSRTPTLTLPARLPGDWTGAPRAADAWVPAYKNPSATTSLAYGKGDRQVEVWVGYYRNQDATRKLVTSTNLLVEQKDPHWAQTRSGATAVPLGGATIAWRTGELRDANPLAANEARARVVWHVYWIGGRWIASDARAKLWAAWDRLLGRGDDGAVLVIATVPGPGHEQALADLAGNLLPKLEPAFEQLRDTR